MHIGVIASMKSGLEQFIYRELRALAGRGATISLYPTKHRPGLYNPPPEWNVAYWSVAAVVLCQPWRFARMPWRYLSALWTAIRYRAVVDFFLAAYFAPQMRGVDVIYATFGDRKLFVGYFCKRLLEKPLAVEVHAYELYQNPNPELFRLALAACGQIVAATEHNREILRDRYGVAAECVEVVRYSVDLDTYRPQKKFVILIVAFFVEKKGHEILLQAVKQMDRDDIEVWVVGGQGGSSATVDVPAIVGRLGLESQVAFFGKLSHTALLAVYHACDVVCLPSRVDRNGDSEGFPNVLIEAMACGKPIVTTRHVEIPRIVEQILVDENDVDGLAAALERVYASAGLRERLGERNRELAEEHFSTENVGETFELLGRLAGGERPRSGNNPATHGTRRRILMLLENESYPDDSRVALEASSLRDAGYRVTVICPTGLSRLRYENVDGVDVYRYPKPRDVGGFVGYVWEYAYSLTMTFILSLYVLVRHGFDVVHAHAPPDFFVLIAAFYKLFGKRYVFDQHDLSPELYQARQNGDGNRLVVRMLGWFEKLACRTADRLIATNETQRRVQIERGGAAAKRCRVVRNGPDSRFLEPIEPLDALRAGGRTVIGYVGVMGVQDRVDLLVRALHHLRSERGREDFLAVIVGDGPALGELKRLVRQLELEQFVQFAGYRVGDDLLRHLASFDIGVTPDPSNSYNDSCTMIKTLEYMALGKPIVAFDLPENRFSAAEAALYADPNDERRLADCIALLMDSPERCRAMGRIGRRRIEAQFSWNHQRVHLVQLYDDLFAPRAEGAEAATRAAHLLQHRVKKPSGAAEKVTI